MLIKQSESTAARRTVYLTAVNTADDSAYTSTLSGSDIMVGKAGGTEAASTGTATHVATGLFKYVFATAECDTLGEVSIRLAKTGVYNDVRVVNVVAFDPYTSSNLGLSNIDTTISSRSSHTVADILDGADAIETGLTLRGAVRLMAAALAGKSTGAGTSTEYYRSAVSDGKVRLTATISANNRTAITTDTDA